MASILVDCVADDRVEAELRRHDPTLHMASVMVYGGVDRAGDDRHVNGGVDGVRPICAAIKEKNRPSLLVGIFGWRRKIDHSWWQIDIVFA
jgi:hypothetical protein